MSLYKEFDLSDNGDVVNDVALVTSGIFQDGASKITTFFTSQSESRSTSVISRNNTTINVNNIKMINASSNATNLTNSFANSNETNGDCMGYISIDGHNVNHDNWLEHLPVGIKNVCK